VHLYLVSSPSQDIQKNALLCEGANKHLLSYANLDELSPYRDVFRSSVGLRILIDSGAFTAHTLGRDFYPEEYAEWAIEFEREWGGLSRSLHFFNLDVIGDQEKTWENQKKLEALGVSPLPVITFGAEEKHIDRALADYDYFSLGGIVPHARGRNATDKVKNWLNFCFSKIIQKFKATGRMPKVHLLGMGRPWILSEYPAYSADTTSWVKALRWGVKNEFGITKSPRVSESKVSNEYILRQEIRKYREVEEKSTKIWELRGVRWEEE